MLGGIQANSDNPHRTAPLLDCIITAWHYRCRRGPSTPTSYKWESMIKELDPIVLTDGLPEHGLQAGDVGWVVVVHGDGAGYEVEFVTLSGETMSVVTLPTNAVRPVAAKEIAHARRVA